MLASLAIDASGSLAAGDIVLHGVSNSDGNTAKTVDDGHSTVVGQISLRGRLVVEAGAQIVACEALLVSGSRRPL